MAVRAPDLESRLTVRAALVAASLAPAAPGTTIGSVDVDVDLSAPELLATRAVPVSGVGADGHPRAPVDLAGGCTSMDNGSSSTAGWTVWPRPTAYTGQVSDENDDMKAIRFDQRFLARAAALALLAVSGTAQRDARFGMDDGPEPGDRAPDITVFDQKGEEVGLRSLLRGHYTTLVLGCLT